MQLYCTACFCRKVGKSRDALKIVYFFFLSYFFLSLFSKILAKTCQNAKLYFSSLGYRGVSVYFFLRISPQIQAELSLFSHGHFPLAEKSAFFSLPNHLNKKVSTTFKSGNFN